jgi:hypothetical protein
VEGEKTMLHHVVDQLHVIGLFHLDPGVVVHVAHFGTGDHKALHRDVRCGNGEHIAIASGTINYRPSDTDQRKRAINDERAFRVGAFKHAHSVTSLRGSQHRRQFFHFAGSIHRPSGSRQTDNGAKQKSNGAKPHPIFHANTSGNREFSRSVFIIAISVICVPNRGNGIPFSDFLII